MFRFDLLMEIVDWLPESELQAGVESKNRETGKFEQEVLCARQFSFRNQLFYVCPVRGCQFLTTHASHFKRHCQSTRHSPLPTIIPNRAELLEDGSAYCPFSLRDTGLIVDCRSHVAVCLSSKFILTKDEIPIHCLICPHCLEFRRAEAANDPEYVSIATEKNLDEFQIHPRRIAPDDTSYRELPVIEGTKKPYSGLTVSIRYLCVPCLNNGVVEQGLNDPDGYLDPTMGYYACENHLFNVHQVVLELAEKSMVTCFAMAFKTLGDTTFSTQPDHRIVKMDLIPKDKSAHPGPPSPPRQSRWDFS